MRISKNCSNFIMTIMDNIDSSEKAYLDFLEYYIYFSVYQFKWLIIYVTCFMILVLVIFNIYLVKIHLVNPIN